MKRPLLAALIFLVVLFVAGYGRSLYESRRALRDAIDRTAEENGFQKAIPFFIQALRWRAPLNPYSYQAEQALRECAFNVECPQQLKALRALREGISGSRSWLTFLQDVFLLQTVDDRERSLIGSPPIEELYPPRWNPWFQLLACLGLIGWLASTTTFIWRHCSPDGTMNFRAGSRCVIFGIGSFALWQSAMLFG